MKWEPGASGRSGTRRGAADAGERRVPRVDRHPPDARQRSRSQRRRHGGARRVRSRARGKARDVDARLGRLRNLSYLHAADDAIAAATAIIDTGTWHVGDAYYWRAWNRYQARQLDEAWADVRQAMSLLSNTAVYALAGSIAYARKDLDTAVAHFNRAFEIDPSNCLAVVGGARPHRSGRMAGGCGHVLEGDGLFRDRRGHGEDGARQHREGRARTRGERTAPGQHAEAPRIRRGSARAGHASTPCAARCAPGCRRSAAERRAALGA